MAVLVGAVVKTEASNIPANAHLLVFPRGLRVLAYSAEVFPLFGILQCECWVHFLCSLDAAFILFGSLPFLPWICCREEASCCAGDLVSVDEGEYWWETDIELAVENRVQYIIEIDDSVVHIRSVTCLLTLAQPSLVSGVDRI